MPKLSQKSKDSIKALLLKNKSVRAISKLLSIPKSTVYDYSNDLGLKTKNRAGRKKLLSTNDVTFAVTQLSSNKAESVEKLSKTLTETKGIKISRFTLSRELHNAGMRATIKRKNPRSLRKTEKSALPSQNLTKIGPWRTGNESSSQTKRKSTDLGRMG
jgi:transposase